MADFRSYREWSTVRYLESIGLPVGNDRVFPDLAFNLPANLLARGDGRRRKRPVVGIGVMHYAGRLSVDSPCESTYRAYLKTLAEFIEWLFARQYDVSVLVGDAADDVHVVKDLEDLLKVRGSFDEARIIDDPVLTVRDVLTRLAETDAVVATRFHNALLALVLNKPVIMISFHHKCVSLMNEIGLSNYCEDIHCLSADKLIARFAELEQNEAGLKESIKEKVAERRQALDEQYEIIFGGECPVVGMSYLASSGRSCPN
jgi:polysaccharide pyruvyl transferase WcaK-like protein